MAKRRGHNEGTIYRRKDGRWTAGVSMGRDATGKHRRRWVYGRTRKEVQEQLTQILASAQKGHSIAPERQTVGEFFTRWLADTVQGTVRATTFESYGHTLTHIVSGIGHIKLDKLRPEHLSRLYRDKLDANYTSTVTQIHALLHKGLGQAVRWGRLPQNVAALIDPPKVTTKEFVTFTEEEGKRFLQVAAQDRLHALYTLAIATGLRQGELLGLKWEDIDFETGNLMLRRQLQWINGRASFVEPKTKGTRRNLALPLLAISALRRHRDEQAAQKMALAEAWQDNTLVFSTLIGTPINPSNLRNRSFYPILAQADVPKIRFHDLRHSLATLLLGRGVHPKLVQEQLGHSRISVTMDTYSHATKPMMREVATTMDAILTPSTTKERE